MTLKTFKPLLIFMLIFFGMAYFPLIPAELFNIDLNNLSQRTLITYQLCCDIGYMLVLFFIYRKVIVKDFKEYFKNFKENFNISFKYYLVGLTLMIISNLIINNFFSGATANNDNAVRNLIDMFPIYMIFSVAINAPFVEELIFRKSIYDSVIAFKDNKLTKFIYILISGLIFAMLHVVGMTNSYLDYLYVIPYMSLGVAFAWLYVKTGNIFSSISMHSLHNTVTIILYFLQGVFL